MVKLAQRREIAPYNGCILTMMSGGDVIGLLAKTKPPTIGLH
jgi:hypothetical protein